MQLRYPPLKTELKAGNIIGIAYNHSFTAGIFKGYGKAGNLQYYYLHWPETLEDLEDYLKKNQRLYTCFINANPNGRVLLMSEKNFSEDKWVEIQKKVELLFEYKILK